MTRGVFYVASGDRYISDAKLSAESIKEHNPEFPVYLYTTDSVNSESPFDKIITIEDSVQTAGDSISFSRFFPFDRNLFLDADTYVCGDISEVFDVLDRGNVAMAQNASRDWWKSKEDHKIPDDVPDAFPEYNSGVIAYDDSRRTKEFFESWRKLYTDGGFSYNQPSLRTALFRSDVDLVTLPREYNFMCKIVGFVSGPVKILHHQGLSENQIKEFASVINQKQGKRVTTKEQFPCRVVTDNQETRRYKLKKEFDRDQLEISLEKAKQKKRSDGSRELIKSVVGKVKDMSFPWSNTN